jgi:iron-sulfur cluster assembly protein CyaY
MTESEFNELADAVFLRIEQAIEDDANIDYDSNGSVLEMEFDDGSKVIVNRHVPNREIWLAGRSGGYHYAFRDGRWLSQRDGSELFDTLSNLIQIGTGERLEF